MKSLFMESTAQLSDCGRYRYLLTRTWDKSLPVVTWCMLNPSTADADADDPTIRRVVDFSQRWGYGGIRVVNCFAWRETDPKELDLVHDPVGPENDQAIVSAVADVDMVILAWGAGGVLRNRCHEVIKLLPASKLKCLGKTSTGQPFHPLYLAKDKVPVPFCVSKE